MIWQIELTGSWQTCRRHLKHNIVILEHFLIEFTERLPPLTHTVTSTYQCAACEQTSRESDYKHLKLKHQPASFVCDQQVEATFS